MHYSGPLFFTGNPGERNASNFFFFYLQRQYDTYTYTTYHLFSLVQMWFCCPMSFDIKLTKKLSFQDSVDFKNYR